MKLYEEFKEYETLWEADTCLIERRGGAHSEIPALESFLSIELHWKRISRESKEDDGSISIKYDITNSLIDIYDEVELNRLINEIQKEFNIEFNVSYAPNKIKGWITAHFKERS